MLRKLFLLSLFLISGAPAWAATTITSSSSGTVLDDGSGDVAGQISEIDPKDFLGDTSAQPQDITFTQDEDGFFTSDDMGDPTLGMSDDEKEQYAQFLKEQEEKKKPVQYYKGEEALKPKLEPKRTHLMYEQTRY